MRKPRSLKQILADRERRGVGTSTMERVRKSGIEFTETQHGAQVVPQSLLEVMYKRGEVTHRQYEAGMRFAAQAYNAGVIWSSSALGRLSYSRNGGAQLPAFTDESRAHDFSRWSRAVRAVGSAASILNAIVWPMDSGIDAAYVSECAPSKRNIDATLTCLADHYRIY